MKKILVAVAVLALSACGSSPENRAVEACQNAIAEKLADKTFELDKADMLAKLQKQGESGDMSINSTVVFDKGLNSESKQTFDCRVRIDPANASTPPQITFLQFNW